MIKKYSGSSISRLIPGTSGPFREYIQKWLVISGGIGLLTGAAVIVLDEIIRVALLGNAFGNGEPHTGLVVSIYAISPIFSFLLPFIGLVIAGVLLSKFASQPTLSGTDEVLEHYHSSLSPIPVRDGIVKYIASIFTIGFGGSAGLEGPSINVGGLFGSILWRRLGGRFALGREDLRIMLLAGASAGIGAIFKAPLTGIVFALEVPYKDDIARKAFLPSIISGVVSYVTFASVEGSKPLFSFPASAGFGLVDLPLSALLGLIVALAAIAFSALYHALHHAFGRSKLPLSIRLSIGGVLVGFIALLVRLVYSSPYTYGAGYYLIEGSLTAQFSIQFLSAMLVLRMLTTALTLGSGGVGGIFFPQVLFGALTGSLFALLLHANVSVYASIGIAAFMSAGYKTPLAAVTFVGDTTGSVSFLIPAMIASAIAYLVSGETSVSNQQRLREEANITELVGVTAGDALGVRMTPISADSSVAQLIDECLRQRSTEVVVVTGGSEAKIASIDDAVNIVPDKRSATKIASLPLRKASIVSEDEQLGSVMHRMLAERLSVVAVAKRGSPKVIVGTLSRGAILEYIELRRGIKYG